MRFNDIKIITEAQFKSKQEVIDHFVKQGKSAAAGASAWERGWRGHAPKKKQPTGPVRSYHDDLDDKRYGETNESQLDEVNPHNYDSDEDYRNAVAASGRPKHRPANDYPYSKEEDDDYFRDIFRKKREAAKKAEQNKEQGVAEANDPCWKNYKQIGMKKKGGKKVPNCVPKESIESLEQQIAEAAIGVAPKRTPRPGSRPIRGHATESRYKFDKKTGQMAQDNEDPDQRHGLYIDGKLVKTHNTKQEAEIVKQRDPKFKDAEIKKIAEQIDEHKKGVRALKYAKKAKGTVDHLDPKKIKDMPGRKVVGPQKIKQLEKDLEEAAEIMEGAKVDRMVKHIAKSERKLGKSKDEAENIAWATANKRGMLDNKNKKKVKEHTESCEFCGGNDHTSLDESGKASRSLCLSSKSDNELGASQLASCKSQGLRAREGKKSHKIGKTRVTMGGHKIKGKKYGGNIPDWS